MDRYDLTVGAIAFILLGGIFFSFYQMEATRDIIQAPIINQESYEGHGSPYRIVITEYGNFTVNCTYFDGKETLPLSRFHASYWWTIPVAGPSYWVLDYSKIPKGC